MQRRRFPEFAECRGRSENRRRAQDSACLQAGAFGFRPVAQPRSVDRPWLSRLMFRHWNFFSFGNLSCGLGRPSFKKDIEAAFFMTMGWANDCRKWAAQRPGIYALRAVSAAQALLLARIQQG